MHDAFVREHELQLKAAGLLEEEKMVNDCGRPIREQEILVSVLACHYPMEEMEQIISRYDDKTDPHLCFFVKTGYQYEEGLEWLECLRELVTRVSNRWGMSRCPQLNVFYPKTPLLLQSKQKSGHIITVSHYPGQTVLVKLLVEQVSLVLKAIPNHFPWIATYALDNFFLLTRSVRTEFSVFFPFLGTEH